MSPCHPPTANIYAQRHWLWCSTGILTRTCHDRPQLCVFPSPSTCHPTYMCCSTGTYAIAAIWSNLELFLGINAANLALSLSIWGFIRHGKRPEGSQSRSANSNTPRSGHSFGKHTASLRPDQVDLPTCIISSRRDRQKDSSRPRSEGSDIPLEPGIQKKTEFWLVEDASENDSPSDNVVQEPERAHLQNV